MKRIISLLLAAIIILVSLTPVFAQDKYKVSQWAEKDVEAMLKYLPETFDSADFTTEITRLEFSDIVYNVYKEYGEDKEENAVFEDIDCESVNTLSKLGIVKGTNEKLFTPNSFLTRQEAAVILTRLFSVVSSKELVEAELSFKDSEKIADWAKKEVSFLANEKIILGNDEGNFLPQSNLTKEEAIILVKKTSNVIQGKTEGTAEIDPYGGDREEVNTIDNDSFVIAFIGGSLTEGGATWISAVKRKYSEKYSDKEVVTVNAGKGGTTSEYGAARITDDVLDLNPDVVFIEFSINDVGLPSNMQTAYLESMLTQCTRVSKVPAVVYVHCPTPDDKGTLAYAKWLEGVKAKDELLDYYNIKTINVYDYMYSDYEAVKEEKGYDSFNDYLSEYYNKAGNGFDVHGGYSKYSDAIKLEMEKDFEGFITPIKEKKVFDKKNNKLVKATYKQIYIRDPKIHLAGNWTLYNENNAAPTDDKYGIAKKHYKYPYFENGLLQVVKNKAAFGIMTKASAVALNYSSSLIGGSAKVYVDGKEAGTISVKSQYALVNYISNWINLPDDGKEHKVIFVTEPTVDDSVFRFGSIIERF